MTSWDFIITETTVASVLPDEYARYRRPILDALTFFLAGLPPGYQAAVLTDQASLPPTASAPERLARLARSCPALHKFGQTLARDRRIAPEMRRQLQTLESLPPSISPATIKRLLVQELGPLERLGVRLEPPALAEGSVAVVIPFRQDTKLTRTDGTRDGVFKVLKPGIEKRLDEELALLERVGSHLDDRCEDLGIPNLDYRESFEQVREKLQQEVRLDLEQRHLALAQATYAEDPLVHIPVLLDHCAPRVTAMEQVYGAKVTDHRLGERSEKRSLAELVVSALLGRPIFSMSSDILFHGDPHAGNLLHTTEGRLAILDWSLAGTLSEKNRVAFIQIILGAMTLDAGRIADVITDLAEERRGDSLALGSVVRSWLRRIRQGQLPGFTWLTGMLDDSVQLARMKYGPDLLLLRKTVHSLKGVVADIGAEDNCVDHVLMGQFLARLAKEWPQRWMTLPHNRRFPTRLSNVDLAQMILGFPLTATRFWRDQNADLLEYLRYLRAPANEVH